MDAGYYVLSFFATVCTSVISACLYRAIFRPYGWTRKDNNGVAVRFKVFLHLYLQNTGKWILMSDSARYENMMVYFSSGHQWRKYNRWRKRVKKERMKRQQEERKQRFMDMIFKDYQTEPNPEFTPSSKVEPKTEENGEDCYIVRGGRGNPIVAVIPKPGDKLTNTELDKIRADLMLTEQAQEKPNNPRCKDCVHMNYMQRINSERFDTVCVRHIKSLGFEYVWSTKAACGLFEPKVKYKDPLETVQTYPMRTTGHYE